MTTIPLQSKTTITSATAATGVDISSSTYGFSSSGPTAYPPGTGFKIWVRVYGLDSGDGARITIESSTNSFSSLIQHAIFFVPAGPIGATAVSGDTGGSEGLSTAFPSNPINYVVGLNDGTCNQIPWGQSGATLRVNVVTLSGSSPHLTYEAFFTY